MSDTSQGGSSRHIDEVEREIDHRLSGDETPLREKIAQHPVELPLYVLGVVFFGYHIWYAQSLPIAEGRHAILHVGLVLFFWGILGLRRVDQSTTAGKGKSAGFAAYVLATVGSFYYLFDNYGRLLINAGSYTETDVAVGAVVIGLLLLALWFVSRLIFSVVALGIGYSYFGALLPGFLSHRGLSVQRIITMNTVELQGVFGTLTKVVATWVVMFVLLAAIIERYGGMTTFIKGATRFTARRKRIQVGHVAVLASMVFGSINGATTANVATTGSFTIPLMKENGYPPRLAAALESVASSGGQVLPPVMGTSAFIMAELIDPNYTDIIVGAALPAFLFYASIVISIELYTRKAGVGANLIDIGEAEGSVARRVLDVLGHYEYLGMAIMLVYWLIYVQADPMLSAYYSVITLVGLRMVRAIQNGISGDDMTDAGTTFLRESLEGFRRSVESILNITIMVASLGIIVRAFIVTGFAQNLSTQLVLLSGGDVVLMVVMAAIASIVFGMGMPTVAAYLLVALFVAPPLSDVLAANQLQVHMFVFYFAILSNITPPIAVAVVVAQGIAGSSFLETAVDALRMGFPMFLLPFLFVFSPAILLVEPMSLVFAVIVAVGFLALSVGLIGYSDMTPIVRIGFLVAGLGAVFAPWLALQAAFGGLVLLSLVYHHPEASGELRRRAGLE